MNTLTLGVKNAFRNAVRSAAIILILGLSIGLSLVMLIAHQAVGQKINQVKSAIGTIITVEPAGFSEGGQTNNALTTEQANQLKTLPHVTNVTASLNDQVTTIGTSSFGRDDSGNTTSLTSPIDLNSGSIRLRTLDNRLPSNFSLPVRFLGTTDPSRIQSEISAKLTSGATIDGTKDTTNALVSTAMASKNNLHVGSTFQAYNTTLTVVGIFDTGTQVGNGTVVVALPTLQRLSSQNDVITSALVTVDSIDNLASTTSAIKTQLGDTADVQSAQDQANSAIQPLENIQRVSLYSLVGAVAAGAVILLMTMVMIVRERRREIGILKAIGASNLRVMLQFMAEAVTLTILGTVIGVVIGVAGASPVTNVLVNSNFSANAGTNSNTTFSRGGAMRFGGGFGNRIVQSPTVAAIGANLKNIHAEVGWSILAYGFGAAVLIAMVASASAGWLIARVRPSEVMRVE